MSSVLAFALLVLWLPQTPPPPPLDPGRPGPELGQPLPAFSLPDQDGRLRDFASLRGAKGLVLVFYRSADW
jgi:hypothetical protein